MGQEARDKKDEGGHHYVGPSSKDKDNTRYLIKHEETYDRNRKSLSKERL